jgi:hypothetical protein
VECGGLKPHHGQGMCEYVYFLIISHLFNLGVAIKRMNGNQINWTNQIIKNTKNVERCIGRLCAECASELFYIYIKFNFIFQSLLQTSFCQKEEERHDGSKTEARAMLFFIIKGLILIFVILALNIINLFYQY